MKTHTILKTAIAFLVVLMAAGCSAQSTPVKPTPTLAPSSRVNSSGQQIITEGHVTPARSASLGFAVGGIVKEVPAAIGAHVDAGQVLAKLDDSILQKQIAQAQAQVEIAQKQQAQAQAQVTLADKQLSQLTAGGTDAAIAAAQAALNAANANYARVKQGPTADDLALLKANLDSAQAARDQAQSAYDRAGGTDNPYIGMTPQGLQLQQATNAYNAALAAYNAARTHPTAAELAAANAQVQQAQDALSRLTPTQQSIAVAQAGLDAARAAQSLGQAQVTAAQAALETVKSQATNYTLVAPFAGTIMTLDLDPGETAMPGVAVLRLADAANWQIETTDLTELNIVNITDGLPVTLTFDAIPGLELPGKVKQIKPFGETKQGDIVYTVVVTPDRQDERLRWNMTAKVSISAK